MSHMPGACLLAATALSLACVGQPDPTGLDPRAPDASTAGAPDGSPPDLLADAGPGSTADARPPDQPDAIPADQPGGNVDWLVFPAQQTISDASWGAALTDIVRHLPSSYGTTYYDSDKVTHGHETSHGIHSHLRNYENDTGQRANGFYVLADRAALVVEPDIRKSQVAPYVPAGLRGSRFGLYVTGSTSWDDTPLYLWDEWIAYTNGGVVGVDLVTAGMWSYGWRDAVMGQLEFTVYGVATAMAVAELDPGYFASNTQFREFLAWNTRRALDVFRQGAVMPDFQWDSQDAYYQALRTGAEAQPIRQFLRDTFGDAWTDQVLDL